MRLTIDKEEIKVNSVFNELHLYRRIFKGSMIVNYILDENRDTIYRGVAWTDSPEDKHLSNMKNLKFTI